MSRIVIPSPTNLKIPQVTVDPTTPQTAWVLADGTGTYKLSYETIEATVKRKTLL